MNKLFLTLLRLLRLANHARIVWCSGLFDATWYRRQHPNLATSRWPALFHYVVNGCTDDPSRDFSSQEYLQMNPDVAVTGTPAILHYARYGRQRARLTSLLQTGSEPTFPPEATAYTAEFPRNPTHHRRTAIFASYSGNGSIEPYVLHYLRGLREVCDNIVFVSDNPLFLSEKDKLAPLVTAMLVSRHGEYDFGSYKRGWLYVREHNLLDDIDELVFANDSCYGPFHPFPTVFETMQSRPVDFWGLTINHFFDRAVGESCDHIRSFFFAFRRPVFTSNAFHAFLNNIRKLPEPSRENVVISYECHFTRYLKDAGFTYDSLVPADFVRRVHTAPIERAATLMAHYGMPLMKVKTFGYLPRSESPTKVLRVAKRLNPALYADMLPHFQARLKAHQRMLQNTHLPHIDLDAHQQSFAHKIDLIRQRVASGLPIRATFLVQNATMFPSRTLFLAMQKDPLFAPRIVAIPQRIPYTTNSFDLAKLSALTDALRRDFPSAEILLPYQPEHFIPWHDISTDSDLVFYNTPYDNSHFFYNPRFAYGRNFLPIHVNYGFFRSVYDRHLMRMDSFAYFWKALFENEDTLAEYRACSILQGSNGFLAGCCKMDPLPTLPQNPGPRKCVLIAPHHSVEGGSNRVLGLSNFARYHQLFLDLPSRYPQLDFLFRPHPALFSTLSQPHLWGEKRVNDWCIAFRAHSNVRWSTASDPNTDFAASDAIIQDCGSFLVDYFFTGKPCCYLLKSPADISSKFTPFGQDCLSHCYLAYDTDAITQFLDSVVLQNLDTKKDARDAFRTSRVMTHHPHATQTVLNFLRTTFLPNANPEADEKLPPLMREIS